MRACVHQPFWNPSGRGPAGKPLRCRTHPTSHRPPTIQHLAGLAARLARQHELQKQISGGRLLKRNGSRLLTHSPVLLPAGFFDLPGPIQHIRDPASHHAFLSADPPSEKTADYFLFSSTCRDRPIVLGCLSHADKPALPGSRSDAWKPRNQPPK